MQGETSGLKDIVCMSRDALKHLLNACVFSSAA